MDLVSFRSNPSGQSLPSPTTLVSSRIMGSMYTVLGRVHCSLSNIPRGLPFSVGCTLDHIRKSLDQDLLYECLSGIIGSPLLQNSRQHISGLQKDSSLRQSLRGCLSKSLWIFGYSHCETHASNFFDRQYHRLRLLRALARHAI